MRRIANRRATVWAGTVGLLSPLAVLAVATPSDALQTGCVDIPGPQVLCTYGPGLTNFVIPAGVSSVDIVAFGGAGGAGGRAIPGQPAAAGGKGAIVRRTEPVAGGAMLTLSVGTAGQAANGAAAGAGGTTPGTGDGGNGAAGMGLGRAGGGGGATTSVQENGAYLLVAAGGGGAGGGGTLRAGGVGGDALGQSPTDGGPGLLNGPAGGAAGTADPGNPTAPDTGANAIAGPNPSFGGGGPGGGSNAGTAGGSSANLSNSAAGGGAGYSYGGLGPNPYGLNPGGDGRVEIRYIPCVGPTSVSLGKVAVVEGNQPGERDLEFPIVVNNPSGCTGVTVTLAVGGGTATPGVDYTPPTAPIEVTIGAGDTTGALIVPIIGDTTIEPDEFLFARIVSVVATSTSEPTPAPSFDPRPQIGVIRNDDGVVLDCIPGAPIPDGFTPILGTPFDDDIAGTSGNDIIYGLGGRDRIVGGKGNDILCGGSGRDRLLGGDGNDQLSGDGGPDILLGGDGNDILVGGPGDDVIKDNSGNNTQMP